MQVSGNLVGLPWDDLFNVLENPDQLSPQWIQANQTTLLRQLRILCGTLQVETSFLKIPQVALSVDEATFAVGQLVAYEPEAVSELPLAEEILNSLAGSLKRGWQIHHGVGKFAANALTVLATCEKADRAIRAKACDLLLDALGDWLKDHKKCNEKVEEVCGCHCRRASTAACCFLDRVFARPDHLLREQVNKFPRLEELICDLHLVVRDEYGCPFSLTSMLQLPGVLDTVMKSEKTLCVLDEKPVRLAEACMACLSYAMLTVDDHFFTDQSVRCFMKFVDHKAGQGFRRLMSQPISLFMLEGLAPAACCLPSAALLMKRIASHSVTIRCVLSLLLAICTPCCPLSTRRTRRNLAMKENKAIDPAEHRRQATLHLKVMALADKLQPKRPRPRACLLDSNLSFKTVGKKKRCPEVKHDKESKGTEPRRSCHKRTATTSVSGNVDLETKAKRSILTSAKPVKGAHAANIRVEDIKATSTPKTNEEIMSPQLSRLQADIEKLKAEIKQMKNMSSGFLDKKNIAQETKEDTSSWKFFKDRAMAKLQGETCTSLALSTHPGLPPWPNLHVERDPAIAWLLMEMLVGNEKARTVVRGQLNLVEVCKWLQRRLFCVHQGGQDPHEEEPLVLIECDRKGDALQELRVAAENKVGIFGDISGQIEVHFKNEAANGPAVLREWFVHACRLIALPKQNLLASHDMGVTVMPSPSSHLTNKDPLKDFTIFGRLVGLALFRRVPIALRFNKAFCKLIVNGGELYDWNYDDIKDLDPVLYRNKIRYILDNPVEDLDLHFTDVLDDRNGTGVQIEGSDEQIELIENGANIRVTDENKAEYVKKVCEWRLYGCVKKQTEAFLAGFHSLIPRATVKGLQSVITPEGFANLVAGLPYVDANDWQKHSRCSGGYAPTDKQVLWFWEVVHEFTSEQRASLLHFVTGTRNPPVGGFARLQGFNGDQKFTISRIQTQIAALPSAHACICTIDLPPYTSKEMLRERIIKAVSMGGVGFDGHDEDEEM